MTRSGQVKSNQIMVRSCKIGIDQVRPCKIRSGQDRSDQLSSRSGQVKS